MVGKVFIIEAIHQFRTSETKFSSYANIYTNTLWWPKDTAEKVKEVKARNRNIFRFSLRKGNCIVDEPMNGPGHIDGYENNIIKMSWHNFPLSDVLLIFTPLYLRLHSSLFLYASFLFSLVLLFDSGSRRGLSFFIFSLRIHRERRWV